MEEKFDVLNEFGEFTGEVATREECHKKGLWHRAVYAFIIDKNSNILFPHNWFEIFHHVAGRIKNMA